MIQYLENLVASELRTLNQVLRRGPWTGLGVRSLLRVVVVFFLVRHVRA